MSAAERDADGGIPDGQSDRSKGQAGSGRLWRPARRTLHSVVRPPGASRAAEGNNPGAASSNTLTPTREPFQGPVVTTPFTGNIHGDIPAVIPPPLPL